jgi:hypothetical protein
MAKGKRLLTAKPRALHVRAWGALELDFRREFRRSRTAESVGIKIRAYCRRIPADLGETAQQRRFASELRRCQRVAAARISLGIVGAQGQWSIAQLWPYRP